MYLTPQTAALIKLLVSNSTQSSLRNNLSMKKDLWHFKFLRTMSSY